MNQNIRPEFNSRLVKYYDSESGEELTFITNQTDISALDVANLYRDRWNIEIFFKWIKQNLTIKALWDHSGNAVKTHLWVAICTYLIVARIKGTYNCPILSLKLLLFSAYPLWRRPTSEICWNSQLTTYSIKIKMSMNLVYFKS